MNSKIKRIGALLIAAVSAATFTFGCSLSKAPTEKVDEAISQSFNSISEKTTLGKQLTSVSNGGSIEIKYDPTELLASFTDLDLKAAVKLFFNEKDEKAAATADVKLDGASILDLLIYGDPDKLAVSSDTIIGDRAYGVDLKNIEKNFEKSIFAEDGEYAVNDLPEVMAQISFMIESASKYSDMMKDAEKLIEDLKGDIYSAIEKQGKITEEKSSLTFGGVEVKTNAITYTYTGEQLVKAATAVLEYIGNSRDVEKFVDKYNEFIADYLTNVYGEYDVEFDMTDIRDTIDDMIDEMDYADEGFLLSPFTLTVHISSSDKEFVGAELKIDARDEDNERLGTLKAELMAGPSMKELREISFKASLKDDYSNERIAASYTIDDDKDEYEAVLEVGYNGESMEIFTVNHDKESGEYELTLNLEEIDYSMSPIKLEGTASIKSKTSEFTVNTINIDGRRQKIGELTIILNSSDSMPSVKKFTDILTLGEDEFEEIIYEIEENLEDLTDLLNDMT